MGDSSQTESGPSFDPETTLFHQAQAGCAESLDFLLAQHDRLVHWVVLRQQLCGLDYDEAVQAGRYGLWRAVLGFDLGRGMRFSTYAVKAIMSHIWSAVEVFLARQQRRRIPWDILVAYFYRVEPDPAHLQDWDDVCQALQRLVARLPDWRQVQVIQAYYGLHGQESQTLQAIGEQLGLSRERVRQLRNEALVWLRQPAHSQELRSLLARHNQPQYELADELAQAWLKRRGGRHGRR
jgi:RNA polymerase sigma factor (sigma-70 family)